MADDETTADTETAPDPVEDTAPAEDATPAETAATPVAATGTDHGTPRGRHNGRKVREGIVSSAAMQQTVVVTVTSRVRHPLYRKTLQRTTRLYAHDADNTCRVGDRVRVAETRPLSKLKRWRLIEVLERAK
jgi:small subunit ribosomal protein S17